jgi:hypothetical protein
LFSLNWQAAVLLSYLAVLESLFVASEGFLSQPD